MCPRKNCEPHLRSLFDLCPAHNNHILLPELLLRKIGHSFAGAREHWQSCGMKVGLCSFLSWYLLHGPQSEYTESRGPLLLTLNESSNGNPHFFRLDG